MFGSVQHLLLAFGIVAGAELAGPSSEAVLDLAVYFSAPPRALPWLLFVLIVAWVGQVVGDDLFGGEASGFVGSAPVMTPVALAIARLP